MRVRMTKPFFRLGLYGLLNILLLTLILPPGWPQESKSLQANAALSTLEQQTFGRKFDSESEILRVQRLEAALKLPASAKHSMPYRLSRLYASQGTPTQASRKNQAIKHYNRGLDAEQQGQTDTAIFAYREALSIEPGLMEAYNNLGNLLLEKSQFEEALALYQQGLKIQPNEPLLHRNLGVSYEKTGQIEKAIAAYKIYLGKLKQPDPPIQAIVENYTAGRKEGLASENYVTSAMRASQGKRLTWNSRQLPVRVLVQVRQADEAFALPLIQRALEDWENALEKRLRFQITSGGENPNIAIQLRSGPLMDPHADIGHTQYTMPEEQLSRNQLDFVRVTLNVGNTERDQKLPQETRQALFYRMALHELGHAIGIWGHSPDPGDIMFTHPIASQLSSRDIQTIRKLYEL